MKYNKIFGIMAEKGISQRELAEKIGLSLETVNGRLNGRKPFKTDEVIKLCEILGITDPKTKAEIFLT